MHLFHYQFQTETTAVYTGWALRVEGTHYPLPDFVFANWLRAIEGVAEALNALEIFARTAEPITEENWAAARLLPPIDQQDVWAAGVTYEKSREARQEEAQDGGDIYARVYGAQRPELFFKAQHEDVVGDGGMIGIRGDSAWNVPEPELAVLFNPAMQVVGFTIGNDMSSRSIEGENPLYLPQAKMYEAACALGPSILLMPSETWPHAAIRLIIRREETAVFTGETHTSRLRRPLRELADYLGRSMRFPQGVVLLSGTGVVPPPDFTLLEGDEVQIEIEGIGKLMNTVKSV